MHKSIIFLFVLFSNCYLFGQTSDGTRRAFYDVSKLYKRESKVKDKSKDNLYFEFLFDKQPNKEQFQEISLLGLPESYFLAKLINQGKSQTFQLQDGSLFIVQEAKDSLGNWKPIEHWSYSSCGNSHFGENIINLKRNHFVYFPVKKYEGAFKTEIRLKMRIYNKVYYSQSFKGSIDYSQFDIINKERRDQFLEKNIFENN